MGCSLKCCLLVSLSILGTICIVLGILSMVFIPKFVSKAVLEQAFLGQNANGTDNEMLKMFRDPPYKIRLQVWTVSVQNAPSVVKGVEKPNVVEKGPYTFNVTLHKTNVKFAANQTRLFFRNRRQYFFNPEESCPNCSLSDRVVVPNILYQKIVDISIQHPWVIKVIEPFVTAENETVFINVSVGELLFDGYEDKLISGWCRQPFIKGLCKQFNVPEKIGLFYKQNGTDDGLYEVDTGLRDPNMLDKVYSFNGMEGKMATNFWYKDGARMINGTDAELFRPNLFDQQPLEIFIGQLCRSFVLEMHGTAVTSDIPVMRYAQPDNTLQVDMQRAQGFCNPNTEDFFHNSTIQQAGCAPSGFLDMSSCLPGAPRIFLSAAHLRNVPSGMRARSLSNDSRFALPSDADLSFFDLEPITGVVVGVQQRHQLNVGMLRGNMKMTRNMSNLIVPLIWMNESATIDPHTWDRLHLPVSVVWGTFIAGLVSIIIGAMFLVAFAGIYIGDRIADRIQQRSEEGDRQLLVAATSTAASDSDDPFAPPPPPAAADQPIIVHQHSVHVPEPEPTA